MALSDLFPHNQPVFVLFAAVFDAVGELSNQMQAQTANLPVLEGAVQVGRGNLGGIEGSTVVLHFKDQLAISQIGLHHDLVPPRVPIRIGDYVGNDLFEDQIKLK